MLVEISYLPGANEYTWKLYDGPDGIDSYQGSESSLGKCFEQIVRYRTLNALCYVED